MKKWFISKIAKFINNCIDLSYVENKAIDYYKTIITISEESVITRNAIIYNHLDKAKIFIKQDCVIEGELLVFAYGGSISIGVNSYVGKGSRVWSGDSIIIGNNFLISHNVNVIDTNSHEIDCDIRASRFRSLIKNGHPNVKEPIITAPIIIEDYVWINFNSIILKGVKIGKGAIIAAGSVVTKDVEPFTMVAGNPARVVKNLPIGGYNINP